ncbi:MAG: hypothetical protein AAFV53_17685 [Myxococcota bacterium]
MEAMWWLGWSASALCADEIVDATVPVVLSINEVVAMGGAGIGFARGASGLLANPAAPVVRRLEDDPKTGLNVALNYSRTTNDLLNIGSEYEKESRLLNLGATSYVGRLGGGAMISGLRVFDGGDNRIQYVDGSAAVAGLTRDGVGAVGVGPRFLWVELQSGDARERFLSVGAQGGVAFDDPDTGWNVGLTLRSSVRAEPTSGLFDIGALVLPWQIGLGVAWVSPAVRTRDTDGLRFRTAADMVVFGPAPDDSVALAPLLFGDLIETTQTLRYSPRVGVEAEVLPDRLRLRAGGYREPPRVASQAPRLHATGGAELNIIRVQFKRLLDDDLTLETAFDAAERYWRLGVSIGFWHSGIVGGQVPEEPGPASPIEPR